MDEPFDKYLEGLPLDAVPRSSHARNSHLAIAIACLDIEKWPLGP
jgi:hypothetical protein